MSTKAHKGPEMDLLTQRWWGRLNFLLCTCYHKQPYVIGEVFVPVLFWCKHPQYMKSQRNFCSFCWDNNTQVNESRRFPISPLTGGYFANRLLECIILKGQNQSWVWKKAAADNRNHRISTEASFSWANLQILESIWNLTLCHLLYGVDTHVI